MNIKFALKYIKTISSVIFSVRQTSSFGRLARWQHAAESTESNPLAMVKNNVNNRKILRSLWWDNELHKAVSKTSTKAVNSALPNLLLD